MLRRIVAIMVVVASAYVMPGRNAVAQQPAAPAAKPTTQEIPADPTTPKGTLTMLSRATQTGDSSSVKDLFFASNPQEQKLAGVLIQRTEVYAKFRQALVKALGEDAATKLTGNSPDDEAIAEQRISQADLTIEGDKATVQMKPEAGQRPTDPVQLVKVDGKWRLPVGKLTEGLQPDEVDQRLAEFKTLSDVVSDVTAEVGSGKYKNADEVSDALRGKIATAMLAQTANKPATTGPTAP